MADQEVSSRSSRGKSHSLNVCEACGLAFKSPQELLSHLYSSFSLENDVIEYFRSSRQLSRFQFPLKGSMAPCMCSPQTDEPPFYCRLCKKTFKNSRGLKQHIGKIHCCELKSHGCWICGKKFKSKYALKVHKAQVHRKANAVSCEVCNLSFTSKYIKKYHMQRFHEV